MWCVIFNIFFIFKVAESHQTKQFSSTFSQKLLDALLTGLQLNSPGSNSNYNLFIFLILNNLMADADTVIVIPLKTVLQDSRLYGMP